MAVAALVLAPVVDWIATLVLAWGARHSTSIALRERASTSAILSLAATGIAIPSFAFLQEIDLGDLGTAVLIGGLLLVTVPQLIWLALFALGKFR